MNEDGKNRLPSLSDMQAFWRNSQESSSWTVDVKSQLETLGVEKIFSSGMLDRAYDNGQSLSVSDMYHVAKISVDEKGVTAAAATDVEFMIMSAPPPTGAQDQQTLCFRDP